MHGQNNIKTIQMCLKYVFLFGFIEEYFQQKMHGINSKSLNLKHYEALSLN